MSPVLLSRAGAKFTPFQAVWRNSAHPLELRLVGRPTQFDGAKRAGRNGFSVLMRLAQRFASGAINFANLLPGLIAGESHARALRATIDVRAINALRSKYAGQPEFQEGRKYLRMGWYLRDSMARAVALGLHHSPPLRVLDIGSGAGYFLLACRHFGHTGLGLDLPRNAFYAEMFRLLGLRRVEEAVLPFQRLATPDGQFDLITAFAVTFAKHRSASRIDDWRQDEWLFLLQDLRRLLRPHGRVFLRLNLQRMRGLHDQHSFGFFSRPIPGYEISIVNRRELSLRVVDQLSSGGSEPRAANVR